MRLCRTVGSKRECRSKQPCLSLVDLLLWLEHLVDKLVDGSLALVVGRPDCVYDGTVTYVSAWDVSGGNIQLSIEKASGFYEGRVVIRYRDSQNTEINIQKSLEDI